MGKLTFLKLSEKILFEEKKPLTSVEIWELAKLKGYAKEIGTQGKKPWHTISAQINANIRDKQNSIFIKIKSKPVKFFLNSLASSNEISKIEKVELNKIDKPKEFPYTERDLHPFLAYYANIYLKVFTKTIFHEKSARKKFSQWIHPDIVGACFSIDEWQEEVLAFSKEIGAPIIKIYSFELKRELNFQNLRESFFQAVSNSSWANKGYLVAAEIDPDEEFQFELKRLSTSFGIGIIKIDINEPDSSQIIYSSKYKTELDWENMNKLSEENPDFKYFLKRIKTDLNSNEIRKELYDKVYENADELVKIIKEL